MATEQSPPDDSAQIREEAQEAETEAMHALAAALAAEADFYALVLPLPRETDRWRVLRVSFPCGETAALCQTRRSPGGKWSDLTLVAVSLHLRKQGYRGLGLYNCLDTGTTSGAQRQLSLGRYEGNTLARFRTEAAADDAAALAARRSQYIMVVDRDGWWCVVDAMNAGPPFLQYINDPRPDMVATVDVLADGTVMTDNAAATISTTAPLARQADAELLMDYGEQVKVID